MEDIHPLKAFREDHQPPLSKAGLARLLDVKRATVCRWETGERKIGVKSLPKVSGITGIPWPVLRPDLAVVMSEAAE